MTTDNDHRSGGRAARLAHSALTLLLGFVVSGAVGCGDSGSSQASNDDHGHSHGPGGHSHSHGPGSFPDAVRHLGEDIGPGDTLADDAKEHVIETAGSLSLLAADSDLSRDEWQTIDGLAKSLLAELEKETPDLAAARGLLLELAAQADEFDGRFEARTAHDHSHPHADEHGHGHDHGDDGKGWHGHAHEHGGGDEPLTNREAGSTE
ncbi:MAG: hypothetical protein AAGJ97_07065 [Planctomycetota bacterium]